MSDPSLCSNDCVRPSGRLVLFAPRLSYSFGLSLVTPVSKGGIVLLYLPFGEFRGGIGDPEPRSQRLDGIFGFAAVAGVLGTKSKGFRVGRTSGCNPVCGWRAPLCCTVSILCPNTWHQGLRFPNSVQPFDPGAFELFG